MRNAVLGTCAAWLILASPALADDPYEFRHARRDAFDLPARGGQTPDASPARHLERAGGFRELIDRPSPRDTAAPAFDPAQFNVQR